MGIKRDHCDEKKNRRKEKLYFNSFVFACRCSKKVFASAKYSEIGVHTV